MKKSQDNSLLVNLYQEILVEMDSGAVFGDVSHEASLDNEDTYAPGDSRYPFLSGIQTRNGKLTKNKKKKRKPFEKFPENLQ